MGKGNVKGQISFGIKLFNLNYKKPNVYTTLMYANISTKLICVEN